MTGTDDGDRIGSFPIDKRIGRKRKMQDTQSVASPWLRPCSRCGKPTFSDLLDSEGMCDYCREINSFKVATAREKKKQKGRRTTTR